MKSRGNIFGFVVVLSAVLMLFAVFAGLPQASAAQTEALPEAFDARTLGIVPPIRDRLDYETGWAHSFTAAAEIGLAAKGLADAEEIDLSELQLIYYAYGSFYDPLGNLGEDTNCTIDSSPLEIGGADLYTALLANRWCGLADETVMTYPDDIDFAMNSFGVDGLNRYSHFGDVYAREYGYAFAKARLKDFYEIPADDMDGIKRAILENGCVSTSVYVEETGRYFNASTGAYYRKSAHAGAQPYTVIGWDDGYAVGNFSSSCRPSEPGAWLVRNCLGEEWGQDGYFWLSYEDASLTGDFCAFSFDPADRYDDNYQYDGTISPYSIHLNNTSSSGEAAVFTAQADEWIRAVNFAPLEDTDVEYTVSVYVDPQGDFQNGPADSSQSGYTGYAGIYTVELDDPVFVPAGHDFAVAVRVYGCGDGSFALCYDQSCVTDRKFDSFSDNTAARGYFFYDDHSLLDMTPYGAPRIKAFAVRAGLASPDGFTVSLTDGTAELSWNAAEGAEAYEIWAGTDNGEYTLLTTCTDCRYSYEASAENGVVLKYKVRAIAGDEAGAFSLSRAVRFPVLVHVTGIECPEAVEYDPDADIMPAAGEGTDEPENIYGLPMVEQYQTMQLSCEFSPAEATDKLLTYLTDYPELIGVDFDGTITALRPGIATVYINSRDGNCPTAASVLVTPHRHTWDGGTVVKKASCTVSGIRSFYCAVCGGTETEKIAPLGHKPVVSAAAEAPTCTGNGRTEETACAVCGAVLTASETIPAKGHAFTLVYSEAPDCVHDGYELYLCTVCTQEEVRGFTAAFGHADADEDGFCDVCGEKTGEAEEEPNRVTPLQKIIEFFKKIAEFFRNLPQLLGF